MTGRGVLWGTVKGQRRNVGAGALLVAGHQAGEALVPVLIGVVIDRAVSDGGTGTLVRWLLVLAVVFAALSFSFRFGSRFAERAGELAAHDLRTRVTARVLDAGGGAEHGHLPGELAGIATGDAKRVGALCMALPYGAAAMTGILVSAIALLRLSVPVGLLVLVGTPLLLGLAHLLGRPLQRRSEAEQERAAHAAGVAADLVAGLRILKGLGAEPVAVARYRRISRDSLDATVKAARASAVHDGGMLALNGLFLALVALLSGRLAADGSMSVGGLIAAVGLAQYLIGPLTVFTWVNGELAQARASAGRVAAVLSKPPAVEPGTVALPDPVRGHVELRDITYKSLKGLDLQARPGELLGVVTADPATAHALLDCLGRVADPERGTVTLDGVRIAELDLADLRTAVLVAAHDADLFEGTLADNVAAKSTVDTSAAMAAANADEVAATLPDGSDTRLTERGLSLSGGQRQRIALARALATEAAVLVLHDPTTAVDAVTEARIAAGLKEIRRGRTTIVVTTSPVLLAEADRVVVLDDGAVTAEGGHAELTHREDYRTTVLG
jgi:putative ABC transport system ATP-binding protein